MSTRTVSSVGMSVEGLLRNLRHAAVRLGKQPGATSAILLSLGLAIGVNATFFSYANAMLYRPLALGDADRLVAVVTTHDWDPANSNDSYPDFRDLQERHPLFEGVAATFYSPLAIKTDDGAEVVLAQMASSSYFDVMGVPPTLGRSFRPEEDTPPDGARVAVIGSRSAPARPTWRGSSSGTPGV